MILSIAAHLFANLAFVLFLIKRLRHPDTKQPIQGAINNKTAYLWLSPGILLYMAYLVLLLSDFKTSGLNIETFAVVNLSWIYLLAIDLIFKKHRRA